MKGTYRTADWCKIELFRAYLLRPKREGKTSNSPLLEDAKLTRKRWSCCVAYFHCIDFRAVSLFPITK